MLWSRFGELSQSFIFCSGSTFIKVLAKLNAGLSPRLNILNGENGDPFFLLAFFSGEMNLLAFRFGVVGLDVAFIDLQSYLASSLFCPEGIYLLLRGECLGDNFSITIARISIFIYSL